MQSWQGLELTRAPLDTLATTIIFFFTIRGCRQNLHLGVTTGSRLLAKYHLASPRIVDTQLNYMTRLGTKCRGVLVQHLGLLGVLRDSVESALHCLTVSVVYRPCINSNCNTRYIVSHANHIKNNQTQNF